MPRRDGGATESDHRKIWQIFAEHFYLFRGTPTGVWLRDELAEVFGVDEKLTGANAQAIYDQIDAQAALARLPPRAPLRALQHRGALHHRRRHRHAGAPPGHPRLGLGGRILPTFRPDAVVNLDMHGWRAKIELLSQVCGIDVTDYRSFIQALEQRRAFFKAMGATATDHAALTPYTGRAHRSGGRGHLPARAAGPGHRDGRAALHRPHAAWRWRA